MPDVIRITIKGTSGFGLIDMAYRDKVVLPFAFVLRSAWSPVARTFQRCCVSMKTTKTSLKSEAAA